jgi:hypothetical protein
LFFSSKTQLQFEAAHFWQAQKLLSTFDADFFDKKKFQRFCLLLEPKTTLNVKLVKEMYKMSFGIFSEEILSNTR